MLISIMDFAARLPSRKMPSRKVYQKLSLVSKRFSEIAVEGVFQRLVLYTNTRFASKVARQTRLAEDGLQLVKAVR